jgi:hypothetical protein
MNPLQSRLAGLRRRLRRIVTVRGGCVALAVLVGSVALACLLDQVVYLRSQRDLPGVIRAFFLVGILAGTGYVAYRFLLRPLRTRTDDLSLALRVEERYPVLNDSLASTIEFLNQPEASPGVSKALRGEAINRALRLAQGCDFNKAADTRGTRPALLALLAAGALVLPLVFWTPGLAMTSLARLADPFGGHRWPGEEPQRQLTIEFPSRLTSDQEFLIRGQVHGDLPKTAEVQYEGLLAEGAPSSRTVDVDKTTGALMARERLDTQRPDFRFRFRVRAGDVTHPADGSWHTVEVRQAVRWAPLDGKASPQVELFYPKYTGLTSPEQRAPGSGDIQGVAGTRVKLRAAVNRPVLRVWVEHVPAEARVTTASHLGVLGLRHPVEALALAAGGHAVWGRTYGTVKGGTEIAVDFQPWTMGKYRLVLECDHGLTQAFEFNEHIFPDPVPRVELKNPAEDQTVREDANVPLRVLVEDELYGIRSAYLEYRRLAKDGAYRDAGPARVPLYDRADVGGGLTGVLSALARTPAPAKASDLGPRPRKLLLEKTWSLSGLAEDGEELEIEACAHDFNDVVAFNVPGRSRKIRLRIVGKAEMQALVGKAQAQVEKELKRLRDQQDQAMKKVVGAEQHWRVTGKLRPGDVHDLEVAEMLQQQLHKEVGEEPDQGLRGQVAKLRERLKDNNLEHGAADARLKRIEEELAQLSRNHLPKIPEHLQAARDKLGGKQDAKARPPAREEKGDLGQAREHQKKVLGALDDLLKGLEDSADLQDTRAELEQILQEQRRLQEEAKALELDTRKNQPPEDPGAKEKGGKGTRPKDKDKAGRPKREPQRLTPEQEAKRRELAALQKLLAEKTQKLLDKMKRVGEDRAVKDPRGAEMLEKAQDIARENMLVGEMLDSAKHLHDPTKEIPAAEINRAIGSQEESAKTLKQMVEAMQEAPDAAAERLVQKQRGAAKDLKKLADDLERLRKRVRDAQKRGDAEGLKRARKELKQMQEEVEKKARQLAGLQAPEAGEALDQAGEQLDRAGKQLGEGGDPDQDLKGAQKRVEEAKQKFAEAQEKAEEQLAREQMARIADQLKGLKVRQDAARAESVRLHEALLKKGNWTTDRLSSLGDLAETQQGLSRETASFKEKLKGAAVFELMLDTTARTMERAGGRIKDRKQTALKRPPQGALEKVELAAETKTHEQTVRLQEEASRRLQRLIDALKPEPNVAMRKPKQPDKEKEGDPKKEKKEQPKGGIQGDNIPPLAQLKALRAEQQDVNDRTREFSQRHPDQAKLGMEERAELDAIQQNQERLHELFAKMAASVSGAPAGGGNP